MCEAYWHLAITSQSLALISKLLGQLGPFFVYVSFIQGSNIYLSLRKIQSNLLPYITRKH